MDINDVFERLNFFINKTTGGWFTVSELESLVDSGQLALYSDLKPKYATSQLIKDSLSPFRATYDFLPINTISGFIVLPLNTNYLDLLSISTNYTISGRTFYWGVKMYNEDEIPDRLNSQIDPVTVATPIGEQSAPRYFKLYPQNVGYTGTVTYFRRPVKPVFGYSVISGRVIVYNPATSTQLEWRDTELPMLILKALEVAGINLSAQDLAQFAEIKTQSNYQNVNRL